MVHRSIVPDSPVIVIFAETADYERTHQDVRTEDGIDYGDLPMYVDFPYLVRNIRVNLAAVMNLAMAPADTPACRPSRGKPADYFFFRLSPRTAHRMNGIRRRTS